MDPKHECLNINCSADEVAEYIDRFNFWIDTRGTSDETAIKGAFHTAVGKDAFSLLRTLVYPKTLRDASIAEIRGALLRHVRPAQFELVERAKFHTLVRSANETVREFVVRIQQQASKCNFQEHLDVAQRDRLVAGINRPELQRRLLSEKDTSFQNLRVVCETTEDLNISTQEPAVLLHQSCATPYRTQNSRHVAKRKPKAKMCSSCGGHHPQEECKYRNATCYKYFGG